MALLCLDFAAAWNANAAIFCLLPVWGVVFGVQAVRYIQSGARQLKKWQTGLIIMSIVLLLLFGIVRNIPAVAPLLS